MSKSKYGRWNPNPYYQDPKRIAFWTRCRKYGVSFKRLALYETKKGRSVTREGIRRKLDSQNANTVLYKRSTLEEKLKRIRMEKAITKLTSLPRPGLSKEERIMQDKAIKLYYDPTLALKQAGKLVGKDGAVLSRLIKKLGGVYKRDLYMPTKQDMLNFVLTLKQNPNLSTVEAAHKQGFTYASMRDTCLKFDLDYVNIKKKAPRKQAKMWARFYFAKPTRTFQDVADAFQVSLNTVFLAFQDLGLKRKPRRGRPDFGFQPEKAYNRDTFYFIRIVFRNRQVFYKIGRTFYTLSARFYRNRRMIRRIHCFKIWSKKALLF